MAKISYEEKFDCSELPDEHRNLTREQLEFRVSKYLDETETDDFEIACGSEITFGTHVVDGIETKVTLKFEPSKIRWKTETTTL